MTFGQTLKSYLLWTHPRGSFHYDVMVTLILAFIFLTPRSLFKDSPTYRPLHPNEVTARPNGANSYIYELGTSQVIPEDADREAALKKMLNPVAGNVEISQFQEIRDSSGKLLGYRVWAHRSTE